MSEEILKALMQLFALAVKQDGGIPAMERAWVMNFLDNHLSKETGSKYMLLFDQHAGPLTESEPVTSSAFPSVKDSLRILNICENIGKTLSQDQKVVAMIRLYELVHAGYQFTPQRINILNTVAEVFRISPEEFTAIEKFIRDDDPLRQNQAIVFLEHLDGIFRPVINLSDRQETSLIILHIASADLFFLRYLSEEQCFLNESPLRSGPVYSLNRSSSVRTSKGTILNFSEIVSFFSNEKQWDHVIISAENLSCNGKEPLNKISFTSRGGRLTGIIGNQGSGKTTLLRVIHGIIDDSSGILKINGDDAASLNGVLSGFVPSSPLYFGRLTVAENLRIACSGFDTGTPDMTTFLIKRAIEEAGLTLQMHKVTRSLSREQSSRLNIAMEAIRDPSVLLIDDPFGGLTPSQAFSLMCYLRDLSRKGKVVMVAANRTYPEVFNVFDDVMVLDSGFIAFRGTPSGAMAHFKKLGNVTEPACSCGYSNPDTIFRIIEAPAIDELGNPSDERMVSPAGWAALCNPAEKLALRRKPGDKNVARFRKKDNKLQFLSFASAEMRKMSTSIGHYILLLLLAFSAGALASIVSDLVQPVPRYSVFNLLLVAALLIGLINGFSEYSADRRTIIRKTYLRLSSSAFFSVKTIFITVFSAALIFILLLGGNVVLLVHSMFSNWLLLTASSAITAIVTYMASAARLLWFSPDQP